MQAHAQRPATYHQQRIYNKSNKNGGYLQNLRMLGRLNLLFKLLFAIIMRNFQHEKFSTSSRLQDFRDVTSDIWLSNE